MLFLYNLIIQIASFLLKIVAVFSPKIKLFVEGRKSIFEILESEISVTDKTIWFHSASLGEYEQGLPVIERIKEKFPNHKIVVTFFSPSGYEVRKNNLVADVTVYLPLDTKKNALQFLSIVRPEMVFSFALISDSKISKTDLRPSTKSLIFGLNTATIFNKKLAI